MNVFSCSNKQETCISFRVQRYDDILKAGAQSALRVCDDYVTRQYCMLQIYFRYITERDGDKKIRLEPHEFQPDLFII